MNKCGEILRHIFFFDIKRYSSDRSIQAIFGRLHAKLPGRLFNMLSIVQFWVAFYSKV